MFNKVLTRARNPIQNRIVVEDYWATFEYGKREGDDEDEEDYDDNPPIIRKPLEIPIFQPPPASEKIVNLNGRNLQVIVKLANIHLTPSQPEYPGMILFFFF